MQRRRRPRSRPRDVFNRTTPEDRERLDARRARNNERRQQAIEVAIQPPPTAKPPKREVFRHKELETPHSPPVRIAHNETLSRQTESAISNIESSFGLRGDDTGIVIEVTGVKGLDGALSELQKEDEDSFRKWLMEVESPRQGEAADRLREERGLTEFEMWDDEEVAHLYRDREVMWYEAQKEENNGFLKSFDIRSMDGASLRGLNYTNGVLGDAKNSEHIGDGKIITFKDGVRIVLLCRDTITGAQKGRSIEARVGPYHRRICINTATPGCPPTEWMTTPILMAGSGWPDWVLEGAMRGDGRLDINYQLRCGRAKNTSQSRSWSHNTTTHWE